MAEGHKEKEFIDAVVSVRRVTKVTKVVKDFLSPLLLFLGIKRAISD